MTRPTGRPSGRPPVGSAPAVRVLPRASLAPEHVAALAALVERWQCTESEAIRRALVAAAERGGEG